MPLTYQNVWILCGTVPATLICDLLVSVTCLWLAVQANNEHKEYLSHVPRSIEKIVQSMSFDNNHFQLKNLIWFFQSKIIATLNLLKRSVDNLQHSKWKPFSKVSIDRIECHSSKPNWMGTMAKPHLSENSIAAVNQPIHNEAIPWLSEW